jgi:type I restriction-modification system DNA methylase subunit
MNHQHLFDEIINRTRQLEEISEMINTFAGQAQYKTESIKALRGNFPDLEAKYYKELNLALKAYDRVVNYHNKKIQALLELSNQLKAISDDSQ